MVKWRLVAHVVALELAEHRISIALAVSERTLSTIQLSSFANIW